MIDGVIAIVGRPNVGKSTLFNRIVGERISIVEDTPGVTRDRLYAKANWLTKDFRVIDTGGLQLKDQDYQKEIRMQVEVAIEEADVIVFVTNAKEGMTDDDRYIAKMLHKTKKPVIMAINKVDNQSLIDASYEFYALGFEDLIPVSSVHGIGIGDLLDKIISYFPNRGLNDYEGKISFAIIGRPNVGKSSLVNAILNQERVIVSDKEGTTRDSVDTPFTKDGKEYVVIDTAGIRKKGKVYENIEKYSVLRSLQAIERADVILFVVDGIAGIRDQDKHVAGYAHEAGKPIIIIYNKWDGVEKDEFTINSVTLEIRKQFIYLSYAPILFVSATTKQRIHQIIPNIDNVYNYSQMRIQTSVLNEVLADAQRITPPPTHKGQRLNILYGSQVAVAPPTFVLFVNDVALLHFSYRRYLENRLREAFILEGTPIRIIARKKEL
ncbi:MAG: GTP-binding protein [Erysipelotrichaceae bacterium]|nr:MAG: GTP-binding [Erysipelotrichaceae bacterium]TXT16867.1 MAG: GTP-binding protein [Erysipelotrichaceae bacterium]